jgi:GNAT superfamily N-acetyltransferase
MSAAHGTQLIPVADAGTRAAAESLIREYLGWIGREAGDRYALTFDIDAMVASDMGDATKFYAPHGRFHLALHDGAPVGVGCLKRLSHDTAELQRMYVQPRGRGRGIGRALLDRLLADCRDMGFSVVRLESLKFLATAHTLYRSAGFVDAPPYDGSSMQDYQASTLLPRYRESVVFMSLRL